MWPPKANYQIVETTDDYVLIEDIGPWDQYMSVTNAAESVVEELAVLEYRAARIDEEPAALRLRGVIREHAIVNYSLIRPSRWDGHSTAAFGGIVFEFASLNRRGAPLDVDPAALLVGRVAVQSAVRHRW